MFRATTFFWFLVPQTSLWGQIKIWTSLFRFQETGVLEKLGDFERHWHVCRKKSLPVVPFFSLYDPWRRGKQGGLCFGSGLTAKK